ncbi:MAG: hypothetical protein C4523_15135, partial [Myxococcales bacterium]
ERYFYTGPDIDVFPFLPGVRYYFPFGDKFSAFAGLGFGATASKADTRGADTEGRLALDFHGGVQYEVIPHLGLEGSFDIMLPNLAPKDVGEKVVGRFFVMVGVLYYLPI